MTEGNAFSRFCIPSHLAAFLGRLGAIYHPKTAIDPCCEDVSRHLQHVITLQIAAHCFATRPP